MVLERDGFFQSLRSKSTNKMCFDCNSRNPDWASVQHGVIICIGAYVLHINHCHACARACVCVSIAFRERNMYAFVSSWICVCVL